MHLSADAVSAEIPDDSVSFALRISSDGSTDIIQVKTCSGITDALEKRLPCDIYQIPGLTADFSDRVCSGCIRMVSVIDQTGIQTDNISLPEDSFSAWYPVNNLFVD